MLLCLMCACRLAPCCTIALRRGNSIIKAFIDNIQSGKNIYFFCFVKNRRVRQKVSIFIINRRKVIYESTRSVNKRKRHTDKIFIKLS